MGPVHKICQIKSDTMKNLFEIYTDMSREGKEDMKNILVTLNLMLVFSASAATTERGFLKLNTDKTSLCTRLSSETLSYIMRIGIENIPVTISL